MPDLPPPLRGITVVDLTHHIAGPYCTKLLADYGAEVIKIERPGSGDPARLRPPFLHDQPHPEGSGLFLHLNTNKKSVVIDLKQPRGRRMLLDLARDADILVESFSPHVMQALGLDYPVLREVNPRLVMTSVSNFGRDGPYRDYRASEIVLYAIGGTMHSTGEEDREPIKLGLTVEQFYCGAMAASATMGAFMGVVFGGPGQHLDLSLFEMMAGSQDRASTALTSYQYSGEIARRRGADTGGSFSPVYPAADGYVQFFALQRVWDRVWRMIGRPELIADEALANPSTAEAKARADELLLEWLLPRSKQEVMEKAQAVGLFCGAVNTTAEVFQDPQLTSRGFFVAVDHPYAGRLTYPGAPFKLSTTAWRAGRAPLLGEHTDEVLRERLGCSQEDIERLREEGTIA